jgi:hypothetical protein
MANFVELDDVWQMLDNCLKGYTKKSSDEYWTVKFNGRSYRRIPVGPHGRKTNVAVQSGHIRSLVRFFEIKEDCYKPLVDIH